MAYIHLFALIAVLLSAFCYRRVSEKEGDFAGKDLLIALFSAALFLRVILAYVSQGFNTDMNCFAAWSARVRQVGFGGFYSSEVFTDYPPGFLYWLYVVGDLCSRFDIAYFSGMQLLLIKLPAIACDMFTGALLYREGRERIGQRQAVFLAAAYLFQPAVILDSAVWGQVDSILTLAVAVMCVMLVKRKFPAAYVAYGAGILLKPQMLVFTPVLLAALLDELAKGRIRSKGDGAFSLKDAGRHLASILATAAGMAALVMPFGLGTVFRQYLDTLAEYPYAAVNACNFWGLLGKNWIRQGEKFLFCSFETWGKLAIIGIVLSALAISFKRRDDRSKYPFLAAFVIITMFLFSVRMHERYLYPGLALLLFAYLYRPEKAIYLCYGGFSLFAFYNMAGVLYFYDPSDYDRRSPFILLVSAGMLLCAGYFYYVTDCIRRGRRPRMVTVWAGTAEHVGWEKAFTGTPAGIGRADILLMTALTVLYAGFALKDLGDKLAPATEYTVAQGDEIILEFEEAPAFCSYYIGPKHKRDLGVEFRDGEQMPWRQAEQVALEKVFQWQEFGLEGAERQLRLTAPDEAHIFELCFRGENGRRLVPLNAAEYEMLFDEQELCPERSSFRNGTYFDEIYHARTAYEYLHGMYSYENTHPPLGKLFIALGIALFGMDPFGWRIAGTVFGILMVPVLYLFAKKLTGSVSAAALAGSLFAFDFMHFTQSRIATIDVFITFFVLLMYYFMYGYIAKSLRNVSGESGLFPLGACGVCMGLGVACKWTGIYAGLGLAALFFAALYWQYYTRRETEGLSARTFVRQNAGLLVFCVIFFVCIPVLLYVLSYLPFVDGVHDGLLQRVLYNQRTMFRYHSNLESTHPYSSLWYEWPIMNRPIWYYSGTVSDTVREGISAFGNPLVWWAGIPALLYQLYRIPRRHDGKALFLVTAYAAQYLPWMFVRRLTFIYHYFPSVAFVVLMIVYSLQCVTQDLRSAGRVRTKYFFPACAVAYALAAFGLFLLFYSVLSGAPVEAAFVDKWLRWRAGWVLTAR